jgi:hypothetical protein
MTEMFEHLDVERHIPKQMRHWFNRAGIYQPKRYGLHRLWYRHNYLFGMSKKKVFTAETRDPIRHFRVVPHLNRLDICDGYFDRWANSTGASFSMPRSEDEFQHALISLVARSRVRVLEAHEVLSFDIIV